MKITKKILSFVTAFTITGTMLSYMPVIREELGYDTSMYTASAEGASSENTGTGGTVGGTVDAGNNASSGQMVTGLLVYPIILEANDNDDVIVPDDFNNFNRWQYVVNYGTFIEKDGIYGSNPGAILNYMDTNTVRKISLPSANISITFNEKRYISNTSNAFDNAIITAFENSGFYGEHYNNIADDLNDAVNSNKEDFFEGWCAKIGVSQNKEALTMFTKAIASNRFVWGVEILGEIKNADGTKFMYPLSDMVRVRAAEIDATLPATSKILSQTGLYKAMAIADKMSDGGYSFAGSSGSPTYAFTSYLSSAVNSHGALGCLRPNVENGKWDGNGSGFGGWGIITITPDEAGVSPTNIQIIETATLVAGKNTGYMGVDRDTLINQTADGTKSMLEKEEYAQNGVVANFINRVSSVWENRSGRKYTMTYSDTSTADTTDTGAYPWNMLATAPLENSTFKLDNTSIMYKAILSDGSAETAWVALDDLGNGKLGINTNNTALTISGGTYNGKTIQEVAAELDKDIFFISNAVYVYEGLADKNFKSFEIPQNKLMARSETLLDYINLTSGYWKSNSIGSLYGQYSDVGIPKFDVCDNSFFTSASGLNNKDTSSGEKTTYFIASSLDYEDNTDKDTNVAQYYSKRTTATDYVSSNASKSNIEIFMKVPTFGSDNAISGWTTKTDDNDLIISADNELSNNYKKPSYNSETTRYRYNETGTDGKTLVSRLGLGDVVNIAGFSKFNDMYDGAVAQLTNKHYGFISSNLPATRNSAVSGEAGFARATANSATDGLEALIFKKTTLDGRELRNDGCYLGMSMHADNNDHMTSVYVSGVYKKASVDTKLKANATGYIDRGSSWSDSTNSMTDKGFTTTSSSSFKFYPEVEMQYDTLSSTDNNIYVVGDGIKEVKPLIYSTFDIDTGSTKIDSTAIAVDKRAKALAKKVATDETPVYLPGGILSGTTQDMKLTINSYVLDLNVDDATKNAWGNTGYNPLNDVKAAIEDKVSKVGITQKLVVKDKDTEKGTFGISDGSEEVEVKEIGTPTKRKDYYFFVKDGDITLKGISTFTGEAGSLSETKISNDEGLSAELDDFNKIVEQLKVQDVIDTVLAQNQGTGAWYTEDTSVLKISMYETAISLPGIAFSDKLPLDAGPETADKKDDQYNKGYKAYITAGIKIKDADDNEYVIGESEATGDPSFVIPNVTVVDVAQ